MGQAIREEKRTEKKKEKNNCIPQCADIQLTGDPLNFNDWRKYNLVNGDYEYISARQPLLLLIVDILQLNSRIAPLAWNGALRVISRACL